MNTMFARVAVMALFVAASGCGGDGSSGNAPVSVPNVVGDSQAAATSAITGAGLVLGAVTQASSATVASGNVISETPAAGTSAASGSSVALVVSTGPAPVSVPNVVGDTQTAATTAITGAGLTVGTVTTQSNSTVASGDVILEDPAAGANVASGSAVGLVISSGPPTPAVITGTVAAGTALTGTVSVFDSSASAQPRSTGTAIGTGGQYTVTVTGFTGPFLLQATGQVGGQGPTVTLYSIATAAGTVNITPITTLITLNTAAGNLQSLMTGSAGNLPSLTATDLSDQNSNVDKLLSLVLAAEGLSATYNFSTTPFTAGSAGYDQLLDNVSINSTSAAAVTVTNVTAATTPITIDTTKGSPTGALDITSGPATLPPGTIGYVSVPNLLGDTQTAAATALTGAGLTVGTVTSAASATVASGDVISETPPAATSVAKGSAVALVISSGPPTYTIGGTLIGLGAGATVHVLNGADNLAKSANGTFTLPTGALSGATYSVTVGTPTSSQTCAVQNASGTIASANITNVVVYCTYNVTAATLDAAFTSVGQGFDVTAGGSTSNFDYMSTDTFNGVGAISSIYTINVEGSIFPDQTGTETYGVTTADAIPSYTDNSPGLGGIEGVNGDAIVAAEYMTSGSEPAIYLAVLPDTNATTASINGTYAAVILRTDGNGNLLAREGSGLTLSNGNMSGSLTTNDYGSPLSSVSVSSTYSVAAGLITTGAELIPALGNTEGNFSGAVSADGDLIVMADLGSGDPVTAAVFLHQGTGVTAATFNGVYQVVQYGGHHPSMPDAKAGTVFAYGNGTWSVIYTENTNQGTITTNNTGSGTYTVTADGTLTLTDAEGDVYNGAISADGNALIFGWVASSLAPEIGVGVRQ